MIYILILISFSLFCYHKSKKEYKSIFIDEYSKDLHRQNFYINLSESLPEDYTLVNLKPGKNTRTIIFKQDLSSTCVIKFEETNISKLEEELFINQEKYKIPCFVFKASEEYNFKKIKSFLKLNSKYKGV